MKPEIEVLVFEGCPNAGPALELARSVAARLAPDVEVQRVEVDGDEAAGRLAFPGSPTIRVDGRDVEGAEAPTDCGMSCRIYAGGQGVPAEWLVEAAVLRALRPQSYLFLCVQNSARSQLAEGIARSLAPDGVAVASAGSEPSQVRPEAIAVLAEEGIDISSHRSKGADELRGEPVDAVITLCADEVCPVWLGSAHRLHWGLPDPAALDGDEGALLDALRKTRDELRRRLGLLLAPDSSPSA